MNLKKYVSTPGKIIVLCGVLYQIITLIICNFSLGIFKLSNYPLVAWVGACVIFIGAQVEIKRIENKVLKIVKRALNESNDIGILSITQNDEFEKESRKIARRINVQNTVEEIAKILSKAFSRALKRKFELKDCMKLAEKIHESMKVNNG
jgi:hypothetical protein